MNRGGVAGHKVSAAPLLSAVVREQPQTVWKCKEHFMLSTTAGWKWLACCGLPAPVPVGRFERPELESS